MLWLAGGLAVVFYLFVVLPVELATAVFLTVLLISMYDELEKSVVLMVAVNILLLLFVIVFALTHLSTLTT